MRARIFAVLLALSLVPYSHADASDHGDEAGASSSAVAAQPAPANPWGYNFDCCTLITNPPPTFCSSFPCIATFSNGTGYVVECGDGMYSLSGGKSGVCSGHSGFLRNLYDPAGLPSPSPSPAVSCGVERWSVKTGTDPEASLVSTAAVTTTSVAAMDAQPKPSSSPNEARLKPTETTVYSITATLTVYKREDDSDYHLVLTDSAANTMIVEIPHPACVGDASPFKSAITSTRAKFDAAYAATTSFKTANVPAEWGYYGFFDACDGSVYYNVFDNYVWGDIRSIGGCDYGYYLRHTFQNWHLQIQCYNPLTTKFDYMWP